MLKTTKSKGKRSADYSTDNPQKTETSTAKKGKRKHHRRFYMTVAKSGGAITTWRGKQMPIFTKARLSKKLAQKVPDGKSVMVDLYWN